MNRSEITVNIWDDYLEDGIHAIKDRVKLDMKANKRG